MKKPTKEDFRIEQIGSNKYTILIKKKFLFFFNYWEYLDYQNTKLKSNTIIEFNSFDEAEDFINLAT